MSSKLNESQNAVVGMTVGVIEVSHRHTYRIRFTVTMKHQAPSFEHAIQVYMDSSASFYDLIF
jgi:hypothetical protein